MRNTTAKQQPPKAPATTQAMLRPAAPQLPPTELELQVVHTILTKLEVALTRTTREHALLLRYAKAARLDASAAAAFTAAERAWLAELLAEPTNPSPAAGAK
jgi:hypothetical protein